MSDVISLGKARKAKARSDAKALADINRAKFGRTKMEKARDALEKARRERTLDGAAIEKK